MFREWCGALGACTVASALGACASVVTPIDAAVDADATVSWCDLGSNAHVYSANFAGPTLGSEWNTTAVGTPPAYDFDAGWLELTDASFAFAPSSSDDRSWIYDPTTDLGNQMTWDQAIGDGDFVLRFDMRWSSAVPQLTLAGVGLTGDDHQLQIYAGFTDPWNTMLGEPFARVMTSRDVTHDWQGAVAMDGSGTLRIARHAGMVSISYGGASMLTAVNTAAITHLSIFAVRHRDARGSYVFGSVDLSGLEICY